MKWLGATEAGRAGRRGMKMLRAVPTGMREGGNDGRKLKRKC